MTPRNSGSWSVPNGNGDKGWSPKPEMGLAEDKSPKHGPSSRVLGKNVGGRVGINRATECLDTQVTEGKAVPRGMGLSGATVASEGL